MTDKLINRRKRTPAQKKILKALIDADLTLSAVADYYGHTPGNATIHLMRENEHYFYRAIKEIKRMSRAVAS